MLRLPPTTITLTITEVKEFERRRRFKNYLVKQDVSTQLPIRMKAQPPAQNSQGSDNRVLEKTHRATTPKSPRPTELDEGLKPVSCSPRRPSKMRASGGSVNPNESSSLQSQASGSPADLYLSADINQPIALPPPFSLERRVVSDVQSLPSGHVAIRPETPRESIRRELPRTPIRRPPSDRLTGLALDEPPQTSGGAGARIFSSAARLVGSIVRFPRYSSPTPATRRTGTTFPSRPRRDDSSNTIVDPPRFRVYDDSLPASRQPQTPLNLPDAHHWSRLHGFYTVPARPIVTRHSIQRFTTSQSRLSDGGSPSVPTVPWFRDLYSGVEGPDATRSQNDAS